MIPQRLFCSDGGSNVLELLLDQLFRLRMVKVVQIQPQRSILRIELRFLILVDLLLSDTILLFESLVLFLHHADVLESAEVVVLL